ncbi:MAG: hypothetical protein Q4D74_10475, partial [Comamonadaceae bacterium]|nr:hypothetical protein [Comamonadaceae bacterium]
MKPASPDVQRIRFPLHAKLRGPLAAALMLAGLSSQAQTVNITETFRHATAPDWSLHGHTTLTAATGAEGDAAGTGWLRLTGSVDDQAGSAIYDQAFASTDGIDVQFEYATWRPDAGEGADGFTFYLIDGATTAPTVGARGGSLGYSWGAHGPGVTNGYVGIGFDEWGNFSNHRYGACNVMACAPGATVWKNRVAVRGSGSLLGASAGADPQNKTTGFELLREVEAAPSGASNTRIVTGTRDDAKRVRILITPAPDVKMSVFLNGNT